MGFFKDLFNLKGRGPDPAAAGDASAGPSIRLGVFGKHPAWDDHIDDQGLDTDRLVATRRTFYLNGVAANLDAGTWDALDAARRVDGFDHVFVWRAGGSTVIGRAVASTDGKGRRRYPLVAVAQCDGVAVDALADRVTDVLDDTLARCGATVDRAEVLAILTDARGRFARLAASPPAGPAAETVATLAGCAALGPAGEKLHPVLFQVEREMKGFTPFDVTRTASRQGATAAAVHLRVPACAATPVAAARLWIDVLATRLADSAPVLAVAAVRHGWVDLIVGDPRPQDFFCLLASRQMLPFTTDIPFKMDPAFVARAARWVAELADAGPAAVETADARSRSSERVQSPLGH